MASEQGGTGDWHQAGADPLRWGLCPRTSGGGGSGEGGDRSALCVWPQGCQPVRRKRVADPPVDPQSPTGGGEDHLGSLLWFWANPFHGKSKAGWDQQWLAHLNSSVGFRVWGLGDQTLGDWGQGKYWLGV